MDANKLKVLHEIEYRIHKVCGLCEYGKFAMSNWGECKIKTYYHLKHERTHQLSIHQFGSCNDYKEDPLRTGYLEKFQEFIR